MTPPYILIADDDPSILYLVADILRDEGYAIELARNGREALEVVGRRGPPALVVLDMRMPVVDGWEFASRLRERQPDVPILVMTAARSAREWAAEIEAVGYVAKPFDLNHFVRQVNRLAPPPARPSTNAIRLVERGRRASLLARLRRAMSAGLSTSGRLRVRKPTTRLARTVAQLSFPLAAMLRSGDWAAASMCGRKDAATPVARVRRGTQR